MVEGVAEAIGVLLAEHDRIMTDLVPAIAARPAGRRFGFMSLADIFARRPRRMERRHREPLSAWALRPPYRRRPTRPTRRR